MDVLASALPPFLLAPWLLGGALLASCLLAGLALAAPGRRRRARSERCWFCLGLRPKPSRGVGGDSSEGAGAGWTCTHCQQYNGFTEVLGERERVGG